MPGLIHVIDYEIEKTKRDFFICAVGITILAIILEIKLKKNGKNRGDEVLRKKQGRNKQAKAF